MKKREKKLCIILSGMVVAAIIVAVLFIVMLKKTGGNTIICYFPQLLCEQCRFLIYLKGKKYACIFYMLYCILIVASRQVKTTGQKRNLKQRFLAA